MVHTAYVEDRRAPGVDGVADHRVRTGAADLEDSRPHDLEGVPEP